MGGKPLSQAEKDFLTLNASFLNDEQLASILTVMANYPRKAGAIRKYRHQLQVKRKDKTQIYILLPRNSYDEYKEFLTNNQFLDI